MLISYDRLWQPLGPRARADEEEQGIGRHPLTGGVARVGKGQLIELRRTMTIDDLRPMAHRDVV
jgi:hypothetical protein